LFVRARGTVASLKERLKQPSEEALPLAVISAERRSTVPCLDRRFIESVTRIAICGRVAISTTSSLPSVSLVAAATGTLAFSATTFAMCSMLFDFSFRHACILVVMSRAAVAFEFLVRRSRLLVTGIQDCTFDRWEVRRLVR
jgi:hypothetical protein